MRLLTFTTLYPNPVRPTHGIFVENRLRHLVDSGRVTARVVAPVPWFPSAHPRFGAYAAFARVPRRDRRFGIEIDHPRYPVLPKAGMGLAPILMAAALGRFLRRLMASGERFDLIDAHYFYPDGVAAALLARRLGLPLAITARGTDLNLIARHRWPRRQIRWAAARADGLVTVSAALKSVLVGLGVPGARVRVLRNGVDLACFRPPADRTALRASLGLGGPTLLSVGNLVPLKGHDLVVRALAELDGFELLIAGDGPERAALVELAKRLGVAGRVRLLGPMPHAELPRLYGAADALVLASCREGWPNVLLEAMACGTPVVATAVGGIPEIVAAPEAGVLVRERSPAGLAAGVRELLGRPPDRAAARRHAEGFGWEATTAGQIALFEEILARRRGG